MGRGEWAAEFWGAQARKPAKRRLRTGTKNVRHFRVDGGVGYDYGYDSDWKRGGVDDWYLEIESVSGFVFVDDHGWDCGCGFCGCGCESGYDFESMNDSCCGFCFYFCFCSYLGSWL